MAAYTFSIMEHDQSDMMSDNESASNCSSQGHLPNVDGDCKKKNVAEAFKQKVAMALGISEEELQKKAAVIFY